MTKTNTTPAPATLTSREIEAQNRATIVAIETYETEVQRARQLDDRAAEARAEVTRLETEAVAVRKDADATVLRELTAAGWVRFDFRSVYYGDQGEGDTQKVYLLPPGTSVAQWEGVEFRHGDSGQSQANDQFVDWLDWIGTGNYLEIEVQE